MNLFNETNSTKVTNSYDEPGSRGFQKQYLKQKSNLKDTMVSYECFKKSVDNYENYKNERIVKIKNLKKEIETLNSQKGKKNWKQLAGKIVKVAGILLGYTLLAAVSFGIIPAVIENCTDAFKKNCYGKTGFKIYKKNKEIETFKKEKSLAKQRKPNNEYYLEYYTKSVEKIKVSITEDDKKIKNAIKDLEETQKIIRGTQQFILELTTKEPNSSVFQNNLAEITKKLSSNIKSINDLKNLMLEGSLDS